MTNLEFQEILRRNAVPHPERYKLAPSEEVGEFLMNKLPARLKPTYVLLNFDKLQDDPVSGQISTKTGKMKAVILERYDSKRLLVCIVDTICRQMILVPESCLEVFDG